MRVAFHGATTMTSDLATDVRVTADAGFGALELWAPRWIPICRAIRWMI
jgi:hypothetical protein